MNREDRALLRHRLVDPKRAIAMVADMPIDDAAKRAMRARIRRWAKSLEE